MRQRYDNPAAQSTINPTTTLDDYMFTIEIIAGSGAGKRSMWVGKATPGDSSTEVSIKTENLPKSVLDLILEDSEDMLSLTCQVTRASTAETAQLYNGSCEDDDGGAVYFEGCIVSTTTRQWKAEMEPDVMLCPSISYEDDRSSSACSCTIGFNWMSDYDISEMSAIEVVQMLEHFVVFD